MIVGTAGHIDHGKTALVRALTGVDADRLPEEKARGITIDLGYAYMPTRAGPVIGFVDVPGHERLVHNMLAGATGIDYVLLVVAADDGPMPQTREHVWILDLLGLGRGAVALTKVDTVRSERAHAAAAEVQVLLRGTAFEASPLVHVSSATGAGVADLREVLEAAAGSLPVRADDAHFRLAIDRCFTLKGVGTIVTGTVFAGRVRVGDELLLSPPGVIARVRGIHAQNRPAEEACAGQRCALNLAGPTFDKVQVERGMWALDAAVHAPTRRIDVRLRLLASEARSLKHWTPVHFHLGASDITARVALLESAALEPGATALAQIELDHPLGALSGDRFVIRDQSASRTVGGGVVIDPFASSRERRSAARIALLREYANADPGRALEGALARSPGGVDLRKFETAWNLPRAAATRLFEAARLRRIDSGEVAIGYSEAGWSGLKQDMLDALAAEHRRVPDMIGVARERLRRLTDPMLTCVAAEAAIQELLRADEIRQTGPWLHRPDHHVRLTASEESLWARVRPLLESSPFHPPRVRDLATELREDEAGVRQLLKLAARLGRVYPVAHDHYFTQRAMVDLADIVRSLNETGGSAGAAAFRDRVGTGRKLGIQILEFFDRVGFTRRVGDAHVLRQPGLFEKNAA